MVAVDTAADNDGDDDEDAKGEKVIYQANHAVTHIYANSRLFNLRLCMQCLWKGVRHHFGRDANFPDIRTMTALNWLRASRQLRAFSTSSPVIYDAVIIGGVGLKTVVLERRHVLGGAAVSEELFPGFKFSRASYLLSLLRPVVVEELELKRHGLKWHMRDPSSFTPLLDGRSLTLGMDAEGNRREIAKFSARDAEKYEDYENFLNKLVSGVDNLLDVKPMSLHGSLSLNTLSENYKPIKTLLESLRTIGPENLHPFSSFFTAPASKILRKHFESEPLLSTLATDAVIGAFISPDSPGSGYVLLHHVMGSLDGVKGAWAYVEGGMGSVSAAIASSAREAGAEIRTDAGVKRILMEGDRAVGVELLDGTVIKARAVISNATPKVTFQDLLPVGVLGADDATAVKGIDYQSATTKINVAVDRLPDFKAIPNVDPRSPMPHHQATIHLGCESLEALSLAHLEALVHGTPSKVPMIEMCIPSALDKTIAPDGKHVVTLFVQYTPYAYFAEPATAEERKEALARDIFAIIDKYAPGFSSSVLYKDVLTPPDIERVFALTGGNIFHGSMSIDQLWWTRPTDRWTGYKTPVNGLFICGSGGHPGGGVMGAAGRNAAFTVMDALKKK
ncbi:Pyridine nucleotide-disulfide oxidoreductase domain-containing protein 2 [Irineochytrium annulatum]|nr:Pyridine nucleotide-disulfide oxidoreductase domain-containing protein 2 [Irineochytrium annulatum]